MGQPRRHTPPPPATLRDLRAAHTNREIAERLGVSISTLETWIRDYTAEGHDMRKPPTVNLHDADELRALADELLDGAVKYARDTNIASPKDRNAQQRFALDLYDRITQRIAALPPDSKIDRKGLRDKLVAATGAARPALRVVKKA